MRRSTLLYFIGSLVLLLGLFFFAKTKTTVSPTSTSTDVSLVVKNNKLVSGPKTITVHQNDKVTIHITADVDGELHLHGYDKHVDFEKGKQAVLSLTTNLTGHFTYELEDTKTEIGSLDVLPR